jgi:hypothetical protein
MPKAKLLGISVVAKLEKYEPKWYHISLNGPKKMNQPIRMIKPMILIFDNNLIPFCSPDAADQIKVTVKKKAMMPKFVCVFAVGKN